MKFPNLNERQELTMNDALESLKAVGVSYVLFAKGEGPACVMVSNIEVESAFSLVEEGLKVAKSDARFN
jgi:hypothetical protein